MKTFEEVLQEALLNARLKAGDRWLIWDEGLWMVYERGFGDKRSRVLIETDSKEEAIKKLVED